MDKGKELMLTGQEQLDAIRAVNARTPPNETPDRAQQDQALCDAQHAKTKAHYEAEIREIFEEIEGNAEPTIPMSIDYRKYRKIKSRYIEEE